MKAYVLPATLIAISVLGGLAAWFGPDEPASAITPVLMLGSILSYLLGTISWIFLLGDRSPTNDANRRRLAVLALGAPTALFAVTGVAWIAYHGDNLWMALPFFVGPALVVWPFVIVALNKLRRPNQAAGA